MTLRSCTKKYNRTCVIFGLLGLLSPLACSQQDMKEKPPMSSSSDAALKQKFRGVLGGQLRVDSTFETARAVIIDVDNGYLFNIGKGAFRPHADKVSGYGGNSNGDRLPMPKHLRLIRYPEDAKYLGEDKFFIPRYDREPILDVTVPVAERIPQEVLDDLRKNDGGLRLKLRIHPDTLLVGWDIERRPGFDPKSLDHNGNIVYVEAVHSLAGGDFREAKIYGGQVVRKGWYIEPKTGKKIETDF